jgi:endonuclease/exonuclease/phosphatase family metal-dependent hydrolase
VRVVTFNTGLLRGGVPYAAERAGPVAAAIAALDADVVSLQELWEDADRTAVIEAAAGRFPHAVAADPLEPLPGDWGFAGNTGVAVISRLPILETAVISLESSIVRRVVLRAIVATGTGPVTILATHLTAWLRSVAHAAGPGGWSGEHRAQCERIADLARSIDGPVVLAGDLNCGPARGGVPELPGSYGVLRAAFEFSPYADDPDSRCTWCAGNPLVHEEADTIIDHVMSSGIAPLRWERVLDRPLDLPDGSEGRVADHYGVAVDFETAPGPPRDATGRLRGR